MSTMTEVVVVAVGTEVGGAVEETGEVEGGPGLEVVVVTEDVE